MFSSTKKNNETELVLQISGMHCVSCAMNIDSALEDVDGVIESHTQYAKQMTRVVFDTKRVSRERILAEIATLSYSAKEA